jgi:D-3-phosphoglycerate dehydrogenase / 2-oxoglutarate reductase
MTKPLVLVTADEASARLSEEARKILHAGGVDTRYLPSADYGEEALVDALSRAPFNAILMRGLAAPSRKVIEAAPHLAIISKHGAGVENVDLKAATEHGVLVVNAAGANADAVAELAVGMMVSLARDMPQLTASLRRGAWEKARYVGREFRGRTVGIVGYGQIGRRTAKLAAALGAQVVICTRSNVTDAEGAEVETDLDRLIRRVDILSLHCALTEETRGMIDRQRLNVMKRGALLINTGRGGLVDEPALIEALKSGQLAGAGLDVYAEEPVDPSNELFKLDNIVACPHVAADTLEARMRVGIIACNNIIDYLERGAYERAYVQNPDVLGRLRHAPRMKSSMMSAHSSG